MKGIPHPSEIPVFHKTDSRTLEEIRRECALEKILLLSKGEFRSLSREIFAEETGRSQFQSVLGGLFLPEEKIFCYAFPNHPQNPVGIQQILLLYRKIKRLHAQSALLLSAAPFEEDASAMPERLGIPVHILGQEALLEAVPPQSISDEQVMDALHARMSAQLTREKVKRCLLYTSRPFPEGCRGDNAPSSAGIAPGDL